MSILVKFENATLMQEERPVVSGVTVEVSKGEFVYLLGKTGSGKSSFLKTIYADLPLGMGSATVAGYDLNTIKPKDIPYLRRKLGIVFQDFQLLSDRTVGDNLKFVMKATGWEDGSKINARIKEVLNKVGLESKEGSMPHELSGGEQQRVSIARALVNDPEIILADEPTGNLDPETSEEILRLLKGIAESGRAVLFATHDMMVYNKFKSRTLMFEGGKVNQSN
ncbi:MAG: ATP-binding cassette domain-containing protein [Sphingobacteriaceae bacterium]|nr:ATP-binding cassette domain-containing protein [Sphingobacteriaceae bacterium]MBK7818012.1 ATP-binding cassette domain-containing protein [Sphingobacteriaceae bacterium]